VPLGRLGQGRSARTTIERLMIVIPDLASLAVFVAAALVLLLTPGPAVLYIVARSIDQGRRAGLVSMLGVHAGTLVHIAAAAAGVSAILAASATAFGIVKYLGATYLVYLGIRRLRHRAPALVPGVAQRRRLRRAFLDGVVVNVLNPKTALFFLAFLPQFVDVSRGHAGLQILTLGVIFVLLGLVTDGSYAVTAGTAAEWLRGHPRFVASEPLISGSMYIGLGVVAALSSGHRK
jgi:threonine/homoserine/homoserine lactone efflux protein